MIERESEFSMSYVKFTDSKSLARANVVLNKVEAGLSPRRVLNSGSNLGSLGKWAFVTCAGGQVPRLS